MALKGQGDPRWIVQDRSDGKNVNNWHWTETDFSEWAKNKLKELLTDLPIETDQIVGKTTSVTTTGDVSVNTRKGKTILFYELNSSVKWEVTLVSSGHSAKGTVEMPYISEENDDTDFEIKFTVEGTTKDDDTVKEKLRTFMIPVLKQKVPQMLSELREVALGKTNLKLKQAPSQKLDTLESVVSTPTSSTPATPAPTPITTPTPSPTTSAAPTPVIKKSTGPRVTTIKLTDKFICRPMDLYQAFIEPNRIKAYAGGDAVITPEKGGKFVLFGGAVQGEILEMDVPNKLVQKWRFSSWAADHYSTVTLTFEDKSGKTILTLEHTNVPEADRERTENGWKDNFFKRIKGIFGYGSLY